jgi:ABC-type phosphate transport system substrate-binding protein
MLSVFKKHIILLTLLIITLSLPIRTSAQELAVIANARTREIARHDIILMFSGLIPRWSDGTPVTVIMLPAGTNQTDNFSQFFLGLYPYQLESAIYKRKLSGDDIKRIFVNSNEEMITTVQSIKGAIGYAYTSNSNMILKVIDQ